MELSVYTYGSCCVYMLWPIGAAFAARICAGTGLSVTPQLSLQRGRRLCRRVERENMVLVQLCPVINNNTSMRVTKKTFVRFFS